MGNTLEKILQKAGVPLAVASVGLGSFFYNPAKSFAQEMDTSSNPGYFYSDMSIVDPEKTVYFEPSEDFSNDTYVDDPSTGYCEGNIPSLKEYYSTAQYPSSSDHFFAYFHQSDPSVFDEFDWARIDLEDELPEGMNFYNYPHSDVVIIDRRQEENGRDPIKVYLTDSHYAWNGLDLYSGGGKDLLVYPDVRGDDPAAEFYSIYMADLGKLDLNHDGMVGIEDVVETSPGVYRPILPRSVWETRVSKTPQNCVNPQVDNLFGSVIWRTGQYPLDGAQGWDEIWEYSIPEEKSKQLYKTGGAHVWIPKLSGRLAVWADRTYGQWNIKGSDLVTHEVFDITRSGAYNRDCAVYYDDALNRGVVVYEGDFNSLGLGVKLIGFDDVNKKVIVDSPSTPVDNSDGIPDFIPDAGYICGIDMDKYVVGYSVWKDSTAYDAHGYNLKTKQSFVINEDPNDQHMVNVNVKNDNPEDGIFLFRNDYVNISEIQPHEETFGAMSDEIVPKYGYCLGIARLQDKEVPLECGDLGTFYLAGDLNQDCYVDLADYSLIASEWLCKVGDGFFKADSERLSKFYEDYNSVVQDYGWSTDPKNLGKADLTAPEVEPQFEISVFGPYESFFEREDYDQRIYDGFMQGREPLREDFNRLWNRHYVLTITDTSLTEKRFNQINIDSEGLSSSYYLDMDPLIPELSLGGSRNIINWRRSPSDSGITYVSPNKSKDLIGGKSVSIILGSKSRRMEERNITISDGYKDYTKTALIPARNSLGNADINRDGIVDFVDLERLSSHWLAHGYTNLDEQFGDLNNDNIIDFKDFGLLGLHWLDQEEWYTSN